MVWQKGISGNPSGRPRDVNRIAELARSRCEEAIDELTAIMRNPKEPTPCRIAACTALLDRGIGKPLTQIDMLVSSPERKAELDYMFQQLKGAAISVETIDRMALEYDPDD